MPQISYRNRLLLKKILRVALIVLAVALVVGVVLLIYVQPYMVYDRDGAHLDFSAKAPGDSEIVEQDRRPTIDDPQIVYVEGAVSPEKLAEIGGYYITTAMLQNPDAVLAEIQKLDAPCAVMIELKSIFGNFYYSTSIEGASTADIDIAAVDGLITYLADKHFYIIAVIPAFSDPTFALQNLSCGLPLKSGALWMDENGCYWLDPANETVLSYLTQIARELSGMGIREVAFSEFRFPTSGNISYVSDKTGEQIIEEAAAELTDFFTGSDLMVSFLAEGDDFPASVCKGRVYVPNVDGSQVDHYAQVYGGSTSLSELVFLTSSRDTRFEDQAVLHPLLTD